MDPIYRFLPAKQPGSPTLVLLHGTGGDENDLLPLMRYFPGDWNVLSVRGQVLENGMPRFFRRLSFGVFDEADLAARADELADFLDRFAQAHHLDPAKRYALGYSNGANIAGAILVRRPAFFSGSVLWRPMQPFREIPAFAVPQAAWVLLTAGAYDPTVTSQATSAWASILKQAGYETDLRRVNAGHELTDSDFQLAAEALARAWN